jgi:hypothetical protein
LNNPIEAAHDFTIDDDDDNPNYISSISKQRISFGINASLKSIYNDELINQYFTFIDIHSKLYCRN